MGHESHFMELDLRSARTRKEMDLRSVDCGIRNVVAALFEIW